MPSSLLPAHFKELPPTLGDVKFASVVWGVTLGFGLLTAWKAVEQMIPIWKRNRCTKSLYIWMVWGLWLDNMALSVICYLFMDGVFKPGFLTFFFILCTWTVQTQLILQIIINRSALLMVNPHQATRLKWTTAFFIFLINISVFCIWIPARLQISPRFIAINQVWDRIEKVLFLLVDAGLNAYFLYLVKARLISQGLDKYTPLFNFNSGIVVVSVSMDILLICMMNLHNSFSYIAFHPLIYMVKLYIELVMTDLIIKVTRKSQALDYSAQRSPKPRFASKGHSSLRAWPGKRNYDDLTNKEEGRYSAHVFGKGDYQNSERTSAFSAPCSGVKKTVLMEVDARMEVDSGTKRESKMELEVEEGRGVDARMKVDSGMEVYSGMEEEFEMSTSSMEELNIEVVRYSGPVGKGKFY